jgi:flagellar basal-body rod protein FlgF
MIRGLYTAASGMLLGLRQQDTIASNLANTNTVGYKHDQFAPAAFGNILATRVGNARGPVPGNSRQMIGVIGSGAFVQQVRTDLSQGADRETGKPLDIMLRGDGFFVVQTEAGLRYTRDGHLDRDDDNVLVNVDGNPILDVNSDVIVLEDDRVRINSNGDIIQLIEVTTENADGSTSITLQEQPLTRLQIVRIDANALVRAGETQFMARDGAGIELLDMEEDPTAVLQGSLEEANVDVGHAATQLYSHARTFSSSQRVFTTINETLQTAVRDIGRM